MMPSPQYPIKLAEYKQRQSERYTGKNNPRFGTHLSEELKQRISESEKGKIVSLETRERISKAGMGRVVQLETREKIRQKLKGTTRPPEVIEKMRQGFAEWLKNHPEERQKRRERMLARPRNEEAIRKTSEANRGRKVSDALKKRLSELNSKENHPQWKGGQSFDPYCIRFDEYFKERVRIFTGYVCFECGTPQNGYKLHIHHVTFDKNVCCNDSIPLFVPLCRSCHTKTNFRRPYWQQHFTDIINSYYGGKCYLTKEEMEAYCES